mmetsp:Transcript_34792/g.75992  ORF Transcript_34792/g.75992 Transcript_34792/m.75992 type:complete len:86 (+) Transcript_34792:475-732(+)
MLMVVTVAVNQCELQIMEMRNKVDHMDEKMMSMIHDLKNPLIGTICQLDELEEFNLSAQIPLLGKKVTDIKTEIEEAFQLIDNFR